MSDLTSASLPPRGTSGSRIDWAAVLGGTVVAAAIAGLCTVFGGALGLSTISAEPSEGSFSIWLVVTAIWTVITLVLSYIAGGYVAGRMRRRGDDASAEEVATCDGINGLVVWGLGILLSGWLAAGAISGAVSAVGASANAAGSAIGGVAQGVGSAAGGALQGVAQSVGAAIPENATDDGSGVLDYISSTLMRPSLDGVVDADGATNPGTPSMDDAELARQSGVVLGNVLRTGEISEDDRAFLIAAVARRTELTETEVEARVDQAIQAVQDARAEAERLATEAQAEAERLAEEAKQAAISAAETSRKSAMMTAFLLTVASLIAGAAAVMGAVRGGRHRDEGRVWGGFKSLS